MASEKNTEEETFASKHTGKLMLLCAVAGLALGILNDRPWKQKRLNKLNDGKRKYRKRTNTVKKRR